jgi:DNA-binding NtrC family response regulator
MGTYYRAEKTSERPFVSPPALFALSAMDRACIEHLVGHTLARVEREFILQTLRRYEGNRTRATDRLGISIRSLRDRIRNYRHQGECVPDSKRGSLKH